MPASSSEEYLLDLARRTFLKPWVIPNAYRAPGKELTDLIVIFGDDVIIISDKAISFDASKAQRWRRKAICESINQIKGALRALTDAAPEIFVDGKAREKSELASVLPPIERRRIHLISISRPDPDPTRVPRGWTGLRTVKPPQQSPLDISPTCSDGDFIHFFDGDSIDLLLRVLDTAPDFISYLKAREQVLKRLDRYEFFEQDFLATSISDWCMGSAWAPGALGITQVQSGKWKELCKSSILSDFKNLNESSYKIDRLIELMGDAYTAKTLFGPGIEYNYHEFVMRKLASEGRVARRLLVAAFNEIHNQDGCDHFWSAVLPSPTHPWLYYIWFLYPQPMLGFERDKILKDIRVRLRRRMEGVAGRFCANGVIGIATSNKDCTIDVTGIEYLDSSRWNEVERQRSVKLNPFYGLALFKEHRNSPY